VILGLPPGDALLVYQDQAPVGEDEEVPEDLEGPQDLLSVHQKGVEILLQLLRIDLARIA
jgi:hypothetical protein